MSMPSVIFRLQEAVKAQRLRVEKLKGCREELSQALIEATGERDEQAKLLRAARAQAAELQERLGTAERELQGAESLHSRSVQAARHVLLLTTLLARHSKASSVGTVKGKAAAVQGGGT